MNIVLFKKQIKLRTIAMLVFAIIAAIWAIGMYIGLKTEYLEYKEIGQNFTNTFWINLKTKALVMTVSFVFIYLVIYITNIFIRKGLKKICEKENVMYQKTPNKSLSVILALIGSYTFAKSSSGLILSFLNSTWFNVSDPIYSKNISYYIFQRPLYISLVQSLTSLLVALIIYTIAYYIVAFSTLLVNGISKENFKSSYFIPHIFINVCLLLVTVAINFHLNVEGLVFSGFLEKVQNGKVFSLIGAGFIDVYISRYVYTFLPYITLLCIIVSGIFLKNKKIKKSIITLAVIPVILILHGITIWIINVFFVSPNELEMQRQFIAYNMEYTKQGYNLGTDDEIYQVENELNLKDIENNAQLIDNVRILDYLSTLKVLNQYQTIKGYYTFSDVDIASYSINQQRKAVFIAARELNEKTINSQNYISKRFQYTHGYGIVVTSVNEIDENGYPKYIIKDISSDLSAEGINISQPRIYYGELTKEHVVVNASNVKEFDYPNGDTQIEQYEYAGNGGIGLSFGNKVLMAIKYGDPKLIYSQYINKDSKLLINRNIVERAKKVAPFLDYDQDPYLIITKEGKLVWLLDAYTTTVCYPYSQTTEIEIGEGKNSYTKTINYIRNSVKVTIDAYTGETKFYIIDRNDPLIMMYNKMYPDFFEDIEQGLPEDIWEHIRYPEYLYNIQSEMLLKYHVENVDIFYRNEDVWQESTHNNGTKEEVIAPYYGLTIIDNQMQFALMQQYTPQNRNNLVAWSAIVADKENYGKIKMYTFNKDVNILGPMQLDNQIDQNAEISKDLSLWNSGGSSVIRSMTVIPIDGTLLYVEPIYLAAMNESQIPSIKKIVVSNGNNLAIANTFKEALTKLVNKETIEITVENTETIDGLVTAIIQTNSNMKEALENANWEMYGIYMQKMDDLINELEQLQKSQKDQQIAPQNENM